MSIIETLKSHSEVHCGGRVHQQFSITIGFAVYSSEQNAHMPGMITLLFLSYDAILRHSVVKSSNAIHAESLT